MVNEMKVELNEIDEFKISLEKNIQKSNQYDTNEQRITLLKAQIV